MHCIAKGLGAISNAPSGGSSKATIKARLPKSFAKKETKTKQMWPWLHQIKVYMETQHLEINNEQIHFT